MDDFDRGYFYDWSVEPPITTDPKYRGRLKCGKHQRVLLDGKDMGDVRKCFTGGKGVGWVEKNVRDEKGYIVYPEGDGELATERFYGEVEYICEEEECRNEQRVDFVDGIVKSPVHTIADAKMLLKRLEERDNER